MMAVIFIKEQEKHETNHHLHSLKDTAHKPSFIVSQENKKITPQ